MDVSAPVALDDTRAPPKKPRGHSEALPAIDTGCPTRYRSIWPLEVARPGTYTVLRRRRREICQAWREDKGWKEIGRVLSAG